MLCLHTECQSDTTAGLHSIASTDDVSDLRYFDLIGTKTGLIDSFIH